MSSSQDPNNIGPDDPNQNDIQKLADYISNLSMVMADADRDEAYKFLFQKINVELMQSFITKETFSNICFVINEDENPQPNNKFFLESDPLLKSFPTTIIILIKKTPFINCSDAKSIKKDLHILNFSTEGNDAAIITHIQNCIQTAFGSLFNSYQETLNKEKASALKTSTAVQLQSKMGELIDLINKTEKTSNIPPIKLEYEPTLMEKMEKLKKEKGRPATLEEVYEGLSDDLINKLVDVINKWKNDISQVIKMDRQVKDGDTLFVYEGYDRNIFTLKVLSESRKTLRVVDCVDKCGRCIFPDSVVYEGTTYTVTEIGPKVFNNGSVKEIVFPATLKVICDTAFGGLTTYRIELKSNILPEGLEKIGYKAFLNVRNVSELYIPQSVTSIGENAFKRCGIRRSPRGYYEAYISCLPQFVNDDNCTHFGIDDNALELYVKNLKSKLETIQQ